MRFFRILVLLLITALIISACGPAVVPSADETTDNGQRFLISLPRLVVDINPQGQASINGLSIEAVNKLLPGAQLPDMGINTYYVDWMTNTNVQHIELASTDKGLFLFANGQPLPYLVWDGQSLSNLGTVAGIANLPYGALISKLVPIVQRTGLNIVLRFPTQAGAAEIPMRDASVAPESVEPMAEKTDPALIARVDINYDANGVPTIGGISSRDLAAAGLLLPIELTSDALAQLKANNIQEMRFVTSSSGVVITVNGEALPQIAWNSDLLANSATLYAQMQPGNQYAEMAKMFLPELSNLDVDLRVAFE